MKRSVRLLFAAGIAVLALALAFALAACGDDEDEEAAPVPTATEGEAATTPEPSEEGTTVGISLNEWTITADGGGALSTVQAGEVLFEVHNDGQEPHELVIIKTDTDPATFPASGGKVDEEGVGELIGEVEEFPAGATETGTFGLQPGTYALICNIAGHYEQGMYTSLTVE
jgi:uncharacterized cupredoxin-like copper-binding protein